MRIKYLLAILLASSCTTNNQNLVVKGDVIKIEILNKTPNEYIAPKIIFSDADTVGKIIDEINSLKTASPANVKANMGYYDMTIYLKDKKSATFSIIYSVYDGVVILGSDGLTMNKYYKNDKLESLVLWLFQQHKTDKAPPK